MALNKPNFASMDAEELEASVENTIKTLEDHVNPEKCEDSIQPTKSLEPIKAKVPDTTKTLEDQVNPQICEVDPNGHIIYDRACPLGISKEYYAMQDNPEKCVKIRLVTTPKRIIQAKVPDSANTMENQANSKKYMSGASPVIKHSEIFFQQKAPDSTLEGQVNPKKCEVGCIYYIKSPRPIVLDSTNIVEDKVNPQNRVASPTRDNRCQPNESSVLSRFSRVKLVTSKFINPLHNQNQ